MHLKAEELMQEKYNLILCGLIVFKQGKLHPNQLGFFSGAHG